MLAACLCAIACDGETLPDDNGGGQSESRRPPVDEVVERAFQFGADYIVRSVHTDRCLRGSLWNASNGTVRQSSCAGDPMQQFVFYSPFSSLPGLMSSVGAGHCVTLGGYSGGGYSVGLAPCNSGIFPQGIQVETLASSSAGATVTLRSTYDSGVCLQAPNTTADAAVRFELCDGGVDQRWELEQIFPGTCQGSCGGRSDEVCWCDDVCAIYGDCCFDYEAICIDGDGDDDGGGNDGGGSPCPAGQFCCEPLPGGECNICVPSGSLCP